jgi:hypothetical protein
MVKDTMNDMREHVWRSTDIDTGTQSTETLKKELYERITEEIKKAIPANQVERVEHNIQTSIEKAVSESVKTPSEQELIEAITEIRKFSSPANVHTISSYLKRPAGNVASSLIQLRSLGKVTWEGAGSGLSSSQDIKIITQ